MAQLWWAPAELTKKRSNNINEERWRNTGRIEPHIIRQDEGERMFTASAASRSWTEEPSTDRNVPLFYFSCCTDAEWLFSLGDLQSMFRLQRTALKFQCMTRSFWFQAVRPRLSVQRQFAWGYCHSEKKEKNKKNPESIWQFQRDLMYWTESVELSIHDLLHQEHHVYKINNLLICWIHPFYLFHSSEYLRSFLHLKKKFSSVYLLEHCDVSKSSLIISFIWYLMLL